MWLIPSWNSEAGNELDNEKGYQLSLPKIAVALLHQPGLFFFAWEVPGWTSKWRFHIICNRNNLIIGERRGYLLSTSLLAAKFLSSMLTILHRRSSTIERRKKFNLVIRSSFNLIRCCGIGETLWHWRP